MIQNNNSDELFEIQPDEVPEEEEDADMKISEAAGSRRVQKPEDAGEKTSESEACDRAAEEPDKAVDSQDVQKGPETAQEDTGKAADSQDGQKGSDTAPEDTGEAADSQDGQEDSEEIKSIEAEAKDFTAEQPEQESDEKPQAENDDFATELEEMEREQEDYEILREIGDSITSQVDAEIENSIISDNYAAADNRQDMNREAEEAGRSTFFRDIKAAFALIPLWAYIVGGVAILLALGIIWLNTSQAGAKLIVKIGSHYVAEHVDYEPVKQVEQIDVPDEIDEKMTVKKAEADPDIEVLDDSFAIVTPELTPIPESEVPDTSGETEEMSPVTEKSVYNLLFIGEENIGSGNYRGRSDLIMVASMNMSKGTLKLISIMRDSFVAIPGYSDNRVNAAYAIGGVQLLYDTLKLNFGLEFDNYMLVDFDSFERIVDELGGVDMTLTSSEAAYLNKTNYISKPEYRNVSEGANHLNGNQLLGYCRVRHVATAGHEYNDFGRTTRQRNVLTNIYKSFSGKNYIELMGIADRCLPYVKTDLTAEQLEKYVTELLKIGLDTEIEQHRIPVAGTYSSAYIRNMLVTQVDLQENANELFRIIYGE